MLKVLPARIAQPVAPGGKQLSFQSSQLANIGTVKWGSQFPERRLQRPNDPVRLGNQPSVELQGWQHPVRADPFVPVLFLAVAEHGHLPDPVRDPLLLQEHPNFLAVGTPGMVVSVQGNPDFTLWLAKQPQGGLAGCGSIDKVLGLELPANLSGWETPMSLFFRQT